MYNQPMGGSQMMAQQIMQNPQMRQRLMQMMQQRQGMAGGPQQAMQQAQMQGQQAMAAQAQQRAQEQQRQQQMMQMAMQGMGGQGQGAPVTDMSSQAGAGDMARLAKPNMPPMQNQAPMGAPKPNPSTMMAGNPMQGSGGMSMRSAAQGNPTLAQGMDQNRFLQQLQARLGLA